MKRLLTRLTLIVFSFFLFSANLYAQPPEITNATWFDQNGDGNIDRVSLSLTENPTITDGGGAVDGFAAIVVNDGTSDHVLDNQDVSVFSGTNSLTLNFTGDQISGTGITGLNVTYVDLGGGNDPAIFNMGSEMGNGETEAADTDGAHPVISDATWSDQNTDGNIDRVVLTFSEQVDITDGGAGGDGFDAISIDNGGAVILDNQSVTTVNTTTLSLDFTGVNQIPGTSISGISITYTDQSGDPSIIDSSGGLEVVDTDAPEAYTDVALPVFVSAEATTTTNIAVTFSENISNVNAFGDFTSGDFTATAAGISGAIVNLTVNAIAADFSSVDLDIAAGAVSDGAANSNVIVTDETITDGIVPVLQSVTAVDNNTLQLQYSEDVTPMFTTAGDWTATGMTSTGASQNGDNSIVDLAVNNLDDTGFSPADFALMINDDASDQIIDGAGNNAADVNTVSVVDAQDPVLASSAPSDDDTGVNVSGDILLTFSEIVDVESGNVSIYATTGDVLFEDIDVTSGQTTGTGSTTITVNPGSDLVEGTEYYVLVANTAFDDPSDNSYAGIASTTALSFTTNTSPVLIIPGTQSTDGTTSVTFTGGTVISIADAESDNQSVTISVLNNGDFTTNTGTLTATQSGSAVVGGSGTATLTISGTLTDVNATLDGLAYVPGSVAGQHEITIATDDGSGGTDSETILVNVSGTYTLTVTTDNAGTPEVGSLRAAMLDANLADGSADIIDASGISGTITLVGDLPTITDDLTINGPGASILAIDGADTYSIFENLTDDNLTITSLTISNGLGATNGGAIYHTSSGLLTISGVHFDSNATTGGATGGAIYNSVGSATISQCLFTGNFANNSAGAIYSTTTLNINNSTFNGNSTAGSGGAIRVALGSTNLDHLTISNNSAGTTGDGIMSTDGTTTLNYSIVFGNGTNDVDVLGGTFDSEGTVNIIGTSTGTVANNGSVTTDDPEFGSLATNFSGETQTFTVGTNAIDAATGSTETVDQIGQARPFGAERDLGALEMGNLAPTATDFSLAAGVGEVVSIPSSSFGYDDANGDTFTSVEIATLPGAGTLFFDDNLNDTDDGGGETISATDDILVSDIDLGKLKYIATSTAGNTTFTFTVNDGTTDSSPANTATLYSVENALDFASPDRVSVNGATGLGFDSNQAFSIELWMKSTDLSGIFMDIENSSNNSVTRVAMINGQLLFILSEDGGNTLQRGGASTLNDDLWHHVAVIYSGSETVNGVTIYIDGVEETYNNEFNSLSGTVTNDGNDVSFSPIGNTYTGKLDEVRVWNDVRTSAEIRANAASRYANPSADGSLVLYYDFNQGIPSEDNTGLVTATDLSSSGNDGTLNGFDVDGSNNSGNTSNWVNSTAFASTAATTPNITVLEGSTTYASGGAAYDFGTVDNESTGSATFTILNQGFADLNLNSTPTFGTGTYYSFDTPYMPTVTLSAGQSQSLTVDFNPTVDGVLVDDVAIPSAELADYDLNLTGTGLVLPVITDAEWLDDNDDGDIDQVVITFNKNVDIADNDGTGFGAIVLSSGVIDDTDYDFTDVGSLTLNLSTPISGTGITGLTVTYDDAGTSTIFAEGTATEIADGEVAAAYTDSALPVVNNLEIFDTDDDGFVDRIDIIFSENIDTDDSAAPVIGDIGTLNLPDGETVSAATISDPAGTSNVVSLTAIGDQLTEDTSIGSTDFILGAGIWEDNAGNALAAISTGSTPITDSANPILLSSSPNDGAGSFPTDGNLVFTFSEDVAFGGAGTREINLNETSPSPGTTEDFDLSVPDASILNNVLTADPAAPLSAGVDYEIYITVDAIDDLAGNSFAGITASGDLDFTAGDAAPETCAHDYYGPTGEDTDGNLSPSFCNTHPTSISSLITTQGQGVSVLYFTVIDGSGGADNMNSVTIQSGNTAIDWSVVFAGAELIDENGTSELADNINANNIVFTPATGGGDLGDINGKKEFALRVWFNTDLGVHASDIDGQNLLFQVNHGDLADVDKVLNAGGTAYESNASSNVESGDITVVVVATDYDWLQQPSTTNATAVMSPSVTLEAVDVNGNRDLNYHNIADAVQITSTGTLSPLYATPSVADATDWVSGVGNVSDIVHINTGDPLNLNTSSGALTDAPQSADFEIDGDGTPPIFIGAYFFDTDGDGDIDEIAVQMSEDIDETSILINDFTVANGTVDAYVDGTSSVNTLDVDDNDQYFTLEVSVPGTITQTFGYTQGTLDDNVGNLALTNADITTNDLAAPVFLNAYFFDVDGGADGVIDEVMIEMSEAIDDGTINPAEFLINGAIPSLDVSTANTFDPDAVDDKNFTLAVAITGTTTTSVAYTAGTLTDNTSNANAAASNATITQNDQASPFIINSLSIDRNTDGNTDAVELEFSESIKDITFSLSIADWMVSSDNFVSGDQDDAVTFSSAVTDLAADTDFDDQYVSLRWTPTNTSGTSTYHVNYTNGGDNITDNSTNTNVIADIAGYEAIDGADPIFLSAQTNDDSGNGQIDQIVLRFSDPIDFVGGTSDVEITDFTITGGYSVTAVTSGAGGTTDDDEVILTIGEIGIDTDATPDVTLIGTQVYDIDGNAVAGNTLTALDRAIPVFISSTTDDTDANGQIDQITVLFSEDVDAGTIDEISAGGFDDFSVTGYTITAVTPVAGTGADDNEIELTLTESGSSDTGAVPDVTVNASQVDDLVGNTTAAATIAATDGALPLITDATWNDTNTNGSLDQVVLTFSESVDVIDQHVNAATDGFDGININGGVAIDGDDYSLAGTTTLTLNFIGDEISGTGISGLTLTYDDSSTDMLIDENGASNNQIANGISAIENTDNATPIGNTISIDSPDNGNASLAVAGNTVELSFTVDDDLTTDPVVTFRSGTELVNGAITVDNSSAPVYTASYEVDALDTDGVVTFTIDFTDDAGNVGTTIMNVSDVTSVTVDVSAPTVTILRNAPADQFTNVVNTTGVVFRATFNEPVTNVDAADFAVTGPSGTSITNFNAVSTTVFDITVGSYTADGTIDLNFNGGQDIDDNAGNDFTSGSGIISEETYIIDQTQPTVELTDDHPDGIVKDSDDVLITATFMESNTISASPTITIGTAVVGATMSSTADNKVWTYLWDLGNDSDVDGAYAVSISAADNTGNSNTLATAGTGGQTSYTIDNTAPTGTFTYDPVALATNGSSVEFTLTFDADFDVSSLIASDFTVNASGSGYGSVALVNTMDETFTFTVNGIVGSGTIGIELNAANAQDVAGNNLALTLTSSNFTIDQSASITINTVEGDDYINEVERADVVISGTVTDVGDGRTVNITVTDGTNNYVTTATTGGGTWATADFDINTEGLNEGNIDISVNVTDAATNLATATRNDIVTYDATATVAIDATLEGDNRVNDSEDGDVIIRGTTTGISNGQTVTIDITDVTIAHTTQVTATVSGGVWVASEANLSSFDEGALDIDVTVTDLAGNTENIVDNAQLVIDRSATITIDGTLMTDNRVNGSEDGAVLVTGTTSDVNTGTDNISVSISDGSTTVQTTADATAGSGVAWTIAGSELDVTTLLEGTITVSVSITDDAGNVATASKALTYDKSATVTISTPVEGDNYINDAEAGDVVVTGTTTGIENGQVVTVSFGGGTVTSTATVASNAWTTIADEADISGYTDAEVIITATVSDVAGNAATNDTDAIDVALDQAVALAITTFDANVNASEDNSITVSGTTDAEDGQTISVNFDDSSNDLTRTTTVSGGAWSVASVNVSGLDDGTITITADVGDVAGNTAQDTETFSLDKSASISVNDPLEIDNVINDAEKTTVTISGSSSGIEAAQGVNISLFDGTNTVDPAGGEATVDGSGDWTYTFDISATTLIEDDITITVTSADVAANTASTSKTIHYDPTATVAITTPISTDDLINASEDGALVLSGTSTDIENGQTVTIVYDDGTNPVVNTTAIISSDSWTAIGADISGLDEGSISISISVSDIANNAASDSETVTLDQSATIAINTIEGDDIVNAAEEAANITISGTSSGIEDAQSVTITITDGVTTLTPSTNISSNSWTLASIDISSLSEGNIDVSVSASDVAGNLAESNTAFTLDRLASIAISTPIENDDRVSIAESTTVVISGTTSDVETGRTVSIVFTDGASATLNTTATVSGGTWSTGSFDISSLQDGSISVAASITDIATNTASDTESIDLDLAASVVVTTPIETDDKVNATEDGDVEVSGTITDIEDGQVVTVTFDDSNGSTSAISTTATIAGGVWTASTADISSLDDGTISVSISVNDLAGNPAATNTNIELDNSFPTITNVTLVSNNGTDNQYATNGNTVTLTMDFSDDLDTTPSVALLSGGVAILGARITTTETDAAQDIWTSSFLVDESIDTEGNVTFAIDFTDDAGNVGAQVTSVTDGSSIEVDIVDPTLSGVSLSTNNSTDNQHGAEGNVVTLSFTADDDLSANPVVSILSGGAALTNAVNVGGTAPNYTASYIVDATDTEGNVTFTIDFVDDAGNVGSQVTTVSDASAVEIDLVNPERTDLEIATDNTNNQLGANGNIVTLDFTVDDDLSATPVVVFSSGGVQVENSVTIDDTSAPNYEATYTISESDTEGAVTFTLDFIDDAGNQASPTVTDADITNGSSVTIDITSPTVTVSNLETFDQTPTLTGTVSDNNSIGALTLSVDGQNFTLPDFTISGTDWSLEIPTDINFGIHEVIVTATDNYGLSTTDATSLELEVGGIVVTAPSLTDICIDGDALVFEDDIILTESKINDFRIGSARTLFLEAPENFTYNTSATITFPETSWSADIDAITYTFISQTTLRIAITTVSESGIDAIAISGIEMKASGSIPATSNILLSLGSASPFNLAVDAMNEFEDEIVGSVTSVLAPSAPSIMTGSSSGTVVTEVEVRTGQTGFTLYTAGSGTAYTWYDFNGDTLFVGNSASMVDLVSIKASGDPAEFDINTSGLYSIYVGEANGAGCESVLSKVNVYVFDASLDPIGRTTFLSDNTTGSIISVVNDNANYTGAFSGVGLSNVNNDDNPATAKFSPNTAGPGTHSILYNVVNETTNEEYDFNIEYTVIDATSIFDQAVASSFCRTVEDTTGVMNVSIDQISTGFNFHSLRLRNRDDGTYLDASSDGITEPDGYVEPASIIADLEDDGWKFDPTDVAVGEYQVVRWVVPDNSTNPIADGNAFGTEDWDVNAIPVATLTSSDRYICQDDLSIQFSATLAPDEFSAGVSVTIDSFRVALNGTTIDSIYIVGNTFDPSDPLDSTANGLSLSGLLPANYPIGDYFVDYTSDQLDNDASCIDGADQLTVTVLPKPEVRNLSLTDDILPNRGDLDLDGTYTFEYCEGDTFDGLSISLNAGDSIAWYRNATLSDRISTSTTNGSVITATELFGSTIIAQGGENESYYYVLFENTDLVGFDGCGSDAVEVNFNAYPTPRAPVVDVSSDTVSLSGTNQYEFNYCVGNGGSVIIDLINVDIGGVDSLKIVGEDYYNLYNESMALLASGIGVQSINVSPYINDGAGGDAVAGTSDIFFIERIENDNTQNGAVTGEPFVGCNSAMTQVMINVWDVPNAPIQSEFSDNPNLVGNVVTYYMCQGDEIPDITIASEELGLNDFLYEWFEDSGLTNPITVNDNQGDRIVASDLTDEDLGFARDLDGNYPIGTFSMFVQLNSNVREDASFLGCTSDYTQVDLVVFSNSDEPEITAQAPTFDPIPNQQFVYCVDINDGLPALTEFYASVDFAGSASTTNEINWFRANDAGDAIANANALGTTLDDEPITATELGISGVVSDTINFAVVHTSDLVIGFDDYQGCSSETIFFTVIISPTPDPQFGFDGITAGEITTFSFFDQNNTAIETDGLTLSITGPGSDVNHISSNTMDFTHTFTEEGDYTATMSITNENGCDETRIRSFRILPKRIITAPITYDFNSGDEGWFTEFQSIDGLDGSIDNTVNNSTWQHGLPSGVVIGDDASIGGSAWVTNLSGSYANGEESFLYSPSFDITGLSNHAVSFYSIRNLDDNKDGVVFQYSVDNGASWTTIGDFDGNEGTGVNWYNERNIAARPGDNKPSVNGGTGYNTSRVGWTNSEENPIWQESIHPLNFPDMSDLTNVRFRFALNSNANDKTKEGFGIDDFTLYELGKTVLVEQFSSTSENSKAFQEAIANEIDRNEVMYINYMTDFSGGDILNRRNPAGPSARAEFYEINSEPNTVIDGDVFEKSVAINWDVSDINLKELETVIFNINDLVVNSVADNVIDASVNFEAQLQNDATLDLSFYFAVVETSVDVDDILGDSPENSVGEFVRGESILNVLRVLNPSPAGNNYSGIVTDGQVFSFSMNWGVTNVYNVDRLRIIAFVQSNVNTSPENTDAVNFTGRVKKEVLQAAYVDVVGLTGNILGVDPLSNFSIHPNPGDKQVTVEFDDMTESEGEWIVFDQAGREVLKGVAGVGTKQLTIVTEDIPSGIYLFHMYGEDNSRYAKRLIIMH